MDTKEPALEIDMFTSPLKEEQSGFPILPGAASRRGVGPIDYGKFDKISDNVDDEYGESDGDNKVSAFGRKREWRREQALQFTNRKNYVDDRFRDYLRDEDYLDAENMTSEDFLTLKRNLSTPLDAYQGILIEVENFIAIECVGEFEKGNKVFSSLCNHAHQAYLSDSNTPSTSTSTGVSTTTNSGNAESSDDIFLIDLDAEVAKYGDNLFSSDRYMISVTKHILPFVNSLLLDIILIHYVCKHYDTVLKLTKRALGTIEHNWLRWKVFPDFATILRAYYFRCNALIALKSTPQVLTTSSSAKSSTTRSITSPSTTPSCNLAQFMDKESYVELDLGMRIMSYLIQYNIYRKKGPVTSINPNPPVLHDSIAQSRIGTILKRSLAYNDSLRGEAACDISRRHSLEYHELFIMFKKIKIDVASKDVSILSTNSNSSNSSNSYSNNYRPSNNTIVRTKSDNVLYETLFEIVRMKGCCSAESVTMHLQSGRDLSKLNRGGILAAETLKIFLEEREQVANGIMEDMLKLDHNLKINTTQQEEKGWRPNVEYKQSLLNVYFLQYRTYLALFELKCKEESNGSQTSSKSSRPKEILLALAISKGLECILIEVDKLGVLLEWCNIELASSPPNEEQEVALYHDRTKLLNRIICSAYTAKLCDIYGLNPPATSADISTYIKSSSINNSETKCNHPIDESITKISKHLQSVGYYSKSLGLQLHRSTEDGLASGALAYSIIVMNHAAEMLKELYNDVGELRDRFQHLDKEGKRAMIVNVRVNIDPLKEAIDNYLRFLYFLSQELLTTSSSSSSAAADSQVSATTTTPKKQRQTWLMPAFLPHRVFVSCQLTQLGSQLGSVVDSTAFTSPLLLPCIDRMRYLNNNTRIAMIYCCVELLSISLKHYDNRINATTSKDQDISMDDPVDPFYGHLQNNDLSSLLQHQSRQETSGKKLLGSNSDQVDKPSSFCGSVIRIIGTMELCLESMCHSRWIRILRIVLYLKCFSDNRDEALLKLVLNGSFGNNSSIEDISVRSIGALFEQIKLSSHFKCIGQIKLQSYISTPHESIKSFTQASIADIWRYSLDEINLNELPIINGGGGGDDDGMLDNNTVESSGNTASPAVHADIIRILRKEAEVLFFDIDHLVEINANIVDFVLRQDDPAIYSTETANLQSGISESRYNNGVSRCKYQEIWQEFICAARTFLQNETNAFINIEKSTSRCLPPMLPSPSPSPATNAKKVLLYELDMKYKRSVDKLIECYFQKGELISRLCMGNIGTISSDNKIHYITIPFIEKTAANWKNIAMAYFAHGQVEESLKYWLRIASFISVGIDNSTSSPLSSSSSSSSLSLTIRGSYLKDMSVLRFHLHSNFLLGIPDQDLVEEAYSAYSNAAKCFLHLIENAIHSETRNSLLPSSISTNTSTSPSPASTPLHSVATSSTIFSTDNPMLPSVKELFDRVELQRKVVLCRYLSGIFAFQYRTWWDNAKIKGDISSSSSSSSWAYNYHGQVDAAVLKRSKEALESAGSMCSECISTLLAIVKLQDEALGMDKDKDKSGEVTGVSDDKTLAAVNVTAVTTSVQDSSANAATTAATSSGICDGRRCVRRVNLFRYYILQSDISYYLAHIYLWQGDIPAALREAEAALKHSLVKSSSDNNLVADMKYDGIYDVEEGAIDVEVLLKEATLRIRKFVAIIHGIMGNQPAQSVELDAISRLVMPRGCSDSIIFVEKIVKLSKGASSHSSSLHNAFTHTTNKTAAAATSVTQLSTSLPSPTLDSTTINPAIGIACPNISNLFDPNSDSNSSPPPPPVADVSVPVDDVGNTSHAASTPNESIFSAFAKWIVFTIMLARLAYLYMHQQSEL